MIAKATNPGNIDIDSHSMSNVDDVDSSIKPEHDTSHIEGTVKVEEQDGVVAISEVENKRLRRKIHARYVGSLGNPTPSSSSGYLLTLSLSLSESSRSCVWRT